VDFLYVLLTAVLLFLLSYTNGSNDVSKAIATLAGAGLTSVQGAIAWGTLWTVVGSLSGLFWGSAIIKNISNNIYLTDQEFYMPAALAISIAPILWVSLATWRRWPVSTTHAVVGGLVGAGLMAYGLGSIDWNSMTKKIILPLLVSPFMAIAIAWFLAPSLEKAAKAVGRVKVCLTPAPKLAIIANNVQLKESQQNCIICDCENPQNNNTHGITLSVNVMHWMTSGLLSFSRGLNDTPKLIAIVMPFLMLENLMAPTWLFLWAALAMGAGSWFAGKNITQVLGFNITKMNHEQGFSANLISAILVIGASRYGLPVSTTHVSSSAIMGVGIASKKRLNMKTIKGMLFAWLVTAPVAAFIAALISIIGSTF
jgi:PiT family inorganic phosphate transporter